MNCDTACCWLDAYLDDELDAAAAAHLEAHARACPRCTAALAERRRLRDDLAASERRLAPPPLRAAILAQIDAHSATGPTAIAPPRLRAPAWVWPLVAASLLIACASLFTALFVARAPRDVAGGEVVSAHIRSLMAAHLADVASTDRHTVKPWFAGKLDFAPPVIDLAPEGFPLTGGRLDYLSGKTAAALVYARRAHVINLFIAPDASPPAPNPASADDRGFHVFTWSDGRMRFAAVSDLARDELLEFANLIRDHAKGE